MGQPASLRAVLHVMSDLPADPAASVVGRQLAVCQHLRVKEVVLQQSTTETAHSEDRFRQRSNSESFVQLYCCLVKRDVPLQSRGRGRTEFQTTFCHL